jgi:1-deoxy-D-xylulose-5-phosphate reductoisomerase
MNITILGATGSIGCNTLDVIARHPQRYQIFALTANRNVAVLQQQCLQFQPRYAVMMDAQAAAQLSKQLHEAHSKTEVLTGMDALCDVVQHTEVDCVMAAIVGAAGLLPTLAAARAGKRILLANKEALVMAGALFMEAVRQHNATLLPIDSEHNAIFQCLPAGFTPGQKCVGVKNIILTASGGPFRELPLLEFSDITPDQACAHPTWRMGRKISVDSATMMNKALEVIEAHWLFNMPPEVIRVVLHPQSVIHSLVEYQDGSLLAQLGQPDMRIPIAYALAWPERIESGASSLDMATLSQLNFAPVPLERYPALSLAYEALRVGGTASAILNAANEVTVQAFLAEKISFPAISAINSEVLERISISAVSSLDSIWQADTVSRTMANQLIKAKAEVY